MWNIFQPVLWSNTAFGTIFRPSSGQILASGAVGTIFRLSSGQIVASGVVVITFRLSSGQILALSGLQSFSEAELALALCNCETGLVLTWLGVVLEATEAVHVAVEAFHGADLCLVWLAILLLLYSQERKKLARGTYGKK